MNGWDLFTWIMVVVLGIGSVIIFGFFLRDLGGVLKGQDRGGADPPSE
jgi:hypothetical protein